MSINRDDHSIHNAQSARSLRTSVSRQFDSVSNSNQPNTRSHLQDFLGTSPLAHQAIERDLEDEPEDDEGALEDSDSDSDLQHNSLQIPIYDHKRDSNGHAFFGSYRRPSLIPAGTRPTLFPVIAQPDRHATRFERNDARDDERSLLRDNNIIPPKHPQPHTLTGKQSISSVKDFFHRHHLKTGFIPGGDRKVISAEGAGGAISGVEAPSEETPLIGDPNLPYGGQDDAKILDERWEEAIAAGLIKTSWQRETVTIVRYSIPLVVTFVLQYSLTVASIFTLGHVGNVELGAASLASMSANITGFAIFQGLATSLDTLCAQAYGSGKKHLVGLQMQRMVIFLWVIALPIAVVWLFSDVILLKVVPEPEVAHLAGLYLKILILGLPGCATFESAKRYFQAQGLFYASLYVLVVCAPLNAFMNWFFVWRLGWGFVGAPIAVVITQWLLPLGLFLYVRFVDGMQCWPGFTTRALRNWGPMIKLALPGVVMVEAECLAFEILTLASAYFGTDALAAQSILATLCSITWQLPFPVSIAVSTRIANLIGATLVDAAWMTARVGGFVAVLLGVLNWCILYGLRENLPALFTSDRAVQELCVYVLPVCAAFQLFDAIAALCNGTLRGLGRQEIGGYVQLFFYYGMAMPISFGTAFGLGWGLRGLWLGVAIGLAL